MAKENFVTDDLENLSEEVVFEQIEQLQQENYKNLPQSEIGIQDIAAIALNNMPPKYVCSFIDKTSPRQELLEDLKDLRKYARRQLIKAIKKVSANPHD